MRGFTTAAVPLGRRGSRSGAFRFKEAGSELADLAVGFALGRVGWQLTASHRSFLCFLLAFERRLLLLPVAALAAADVLVPSTSGEWTP